MVKLHHHSVNNSPFPSTGWLVRLLLLAVIFASFSPASLAMSTKEKRDKFREVRSAGYLAWTDKRWADAERLLLEAARYGALNEDEQRFLCYVRRAQLYRSDEALPLAQFLYTNNRSLPNAMELVESLADNGQAQAARDLLAQLLKTPTEMFSNPRDDFALLGKALTDCYSKSEQRDSLRNLMLEYGNKEIKLTYTLSDNFATPGVAARIKARGYFEFYYSADTLQQKNSCLVTNATKIQEASDTAGNKIVRIWPKPGIAPTVTLTIERLAHFYRVSHTPLPISNLPVEVKPYLAKTNYIDPTAPTAQSLARRLQADNLYDTIRNIDIWCTNNMKYGSPDRHDSEGVLKQQKGYCWERSRALGAILRASGIPARHVLVMVLYYEKSLLQPEVATHLMVEFYDPQNGWIPLEMGTPKNEHNIGSDYYRYIRQCVETAQDSNPEGTTRRVFEEHYWGWVGDTLRNINAELVGLTLADRG